ncbi:MAG TPA: DUF1194 domain-containing protein [Hyphomonadaceae bacterium]|nr:DUF1194 domain-containing protein [Hyphomonadaceae bacterium]
MKPVFRKLALAALALAALAGADSATAQKPLVVDLELVLAVDISRSMDQDEHALQRNGYVEAFRDKDVINALLSGPEGKIAVTYMEWAAETYPTIPWTIIDSEKAAHAFADRLAAEPVFGERRTSISTALYGAEKLIDQNNIASHRRVIDVSGDGANNYGPPVEEARDFVVKQGIIVNGLPIMLEQDRGGPYGGRGIDIDHLDRYYKGCVIGGAGAFIAPVFSLQQLAATIRKKLVLEIAGRELPDAAPVQYGEARPASGQAGVIPAQLKLPTEKQDCLAGEKRMQRGFYGGGGFPNFPGPEN